jgi:pimeloyl-ACP methyl ester carboxylesterase
MTIRAFEIHVPQEALTDLRGRLEHARFTRASEDEFWEAGVDPSYLQGLVAYWANGFDWRRVERALNAYPHYIADVAGRRVHFVHLRSARKESPSGAVPLIMTHGWPSCFVEMLPVAERLTRSAVSGGLLDGGFDVVVPSLPGFLFSDLPQGPFTRRGVAAIWHELMTQVLGYPRFGAFGGDIGGGVTQWLGALYPQDVTGVHITSAVVTTDFSESPPTPEEQAFLDARDAYDAGDQGYSEIMSTRPDTIAAALADSPAGLLAWIIDKYRDWSDCGGDLETRWDRDTLLTVATLYWATQSIGSSFRQYYNYELNDPIPQINVPAAVTLSHEPAYDAYPRSLAERVFADLRHWSTPRRGGHFMPHEEPDQVAEELRTFFSRLR